MFTYTNLTYYTQTYNIISALKYLINQLANTSLLPCSYTCNYLTFVNKLSVCHKKAIIIFCYNQPYLTIILQIFIFVIIFILIYSLKADGDYKWIIITTIILMKIIIHRITDIITSSLIILITTI